MQTFGPVRLGGADVCDWERGADWEVSGGQTRKRTFSVRRDLAGSGTTTGLQQSALVSRGGKPNRAGLREAGAKAGLVDAMPARYFSTNAQVLSDNGQTASSGAILRTISK